MKNRYIRLIVISHSDGACVIIANNKGKYRYAGTKPKSNDKKINIVIDWNIGMSKLVTAIKTLSFRIGE